MLVKRGNIAVVARQVGLLIPSQLLRGGFVNTVIIFNGSMALHDASKQTLPGHTDVVDAGNVALLGVSVAHLRNLLRAGLTLQFLNVFKA